ncbi:MAG TPA: sensor domain-containing diguanylate cyclase [Nocardioides sp.]|nr:sensor domain-containing diguanylate cyclase [Nocardioides sp.]
MQHERSRLRGLASLSRALGRPRPLLQLLELAAEEACRILPASSCSVSRTEAGGLSVRTVVNVGELGPGEVRWPEAEYYAMPEFARVDVDADTTVVWRWAANDPTGTPGHERDLLRQLGKQYSMCAPILVDGRLWGEMWASRTAEQPAFDVDDAACLEALLAILSGALSRAEREETLSELAYRDPLTALLNRRAIDERARHVFDVPPGERREVTALALDINGLKATNDRDGHQAGDRLIRSVADALRDAFAGLPGATVARVGGDEFHVLVGGVPTAEVVATADRLVAESWRTDPGTALSCGAAAAVLEPGTELTPTELFAEADRAQYVAKREHRRSTVVAAPGVTATAGRSRPLDAPGP